MCKKVIKKNVRKGNFKIFTSEYTTGKIIFCALEDNYYIVLTNVSESIRIDCYDRLSLD